jgi:competence protein ComEA
MKRLARFSALLFFSLFSVMAWGAGVDINSADASTLAAGINGVGEKRAMAIVKYRKSNGPFESVDELIKVKGIGPKLLQKNREHLVASHAGE